MQQQRLKLHIFGASGTGVTTLGRALAAEWDFPYFDSDDYFWHRTDPPFVLRRDRGERNALMKADLDREERCILGGSVINWERPEDPERVFPIWDLMVFLWLPPDLRMARIRAREYGRYGDVIYNDPERRRHYEEFIAWCADYDHATGIASRTLIAHEEFLRGWKGPLLEMREDLTTSERMRLVAARVGELASGEV
jgi:adenylate kinase family enzyme